MIDILLRPRILTLLQTPASDPGPNGTITSSPLRRSRTRTSSDTMATAAHYSLSLSPSHVATPHTAPARSDGRKGSLAGGTQSARLGQSNHYLGDEKFTMFASSMEAGAATPEVGGEVGRREGWLSAQSSPLSLNPPTLHASVLLSRKHDVYTYIHACMHTYIHTYITHTHTYIHTNTYIYIYIYI